MANPYVSNVTLTSVVDILFQEWNGAFFEKKTLCELGLHVQLGHGGSACPCAIPGPTDFTLFDTNGVHHINIDYCDCIQPPAPPKWVQLLRMQWFLASNDRPRTAFTFDVLEHFHKLTQLVLVSPVLGLQKNWDWTGPGPDLDWKFQGPEKTVTVVQSSVFHYSKISKTD